MDPLVLFFIAVVAVVLVAVGYIFYQQIFRHPLGHGEEIRGISGGIQSPTGVDVYSSNTNENTGGGHN